MVKNKDKNLFRIYLYAVFIIIFYFISFFTINLSLDSVNQKFNESVSIPFILIFELLIMTPIFQILGIIYQTLKKENEYSNIVFDIYNFLNFHTILILSSIIGSYIGFFSIANVYNPGEGLSQADITSIFATRYTLGILLVEIIVYFSAIYVYYRKEYLEQFKEFIKNIGNNILKILFYFILAFVLGLIFTIFGDLLTQLVGNDPTQTTANQEGINNILSIDPYNISFILTICIVGPIVEEYVFRFLLIEKILIKIEKALSYSGTHEDKEIGLSNISGTIIVIISAFTFALAHALSAEGFLNTVLDIFPYLGMSLTLSFVYVRERNIYLTTGIHMLNNIISIILLVLTVS